MSRYPAHGYNLVSYISGSLDRGTFNHHHHLKPPPFPNFRFQEPSSGTQDFFLTEREGELTFLDFPLDEYSIFEILSPRTLNSTEPPTIYIVFTSLHKLSIRYAVFWKCYLSSLLFPFRLLQSLWCYIFSSAAASSPILLSHFLHPLPYMLLIFRMRP
jgi:hypothetical protein